MTTEAKGNANGKAKGLLWMALAIVIGATASLGMPFFVKFVPWSFEERLSKLIGGPPGSVCEGGHSATSDVLFKKIIARIYPLDEKDKYYPVTVEVLKGNTDYAFAYLGGHIYIYQALLNQMGSPEELAGVVAHEIGHIRNRHVLQGIFVRIMTIEALKMVLSGS